MNRLINLGLLGAVMVAAAVAGCGGDQASSEAVAPKFAAERDSLATDPPAASGSLAASGDSNDPPASASSAASGDASGSERAASAK